MDERVIQFRVGVTFLAAFLVAGILLVLLGKLPTLTGRTYDVQIIFSDATGVAESTPVRKSGILIGRVSHVELINDDSQVLVTAKIQSDKSIYKNDECRVTRNLISGDTALTFAPVPGKPGAGKQITLDEPLQGRPSNDPTGLKQELREPIETVNTTGKALAEASAKLGEAADEVKKFLDSQTQKDARAVLRDSAKALGAIQKILGDEETQAKLTEAMKKLPDTLDSMNATFDATNQTLIKFTQRAPDGKTPVERLVSTVEMTEQTLRKFSQPAHEGELAPADQIAKAMENLNDITDLVRTITSRIEKGEGSLGALIQDRQLYDRLNRAAKNIEDVSYRLKPIVEDARVITDKIARHPGVIVRDAVKPGVGIK
jgi:phospholipid/cholesterol/gamma-HCH transport system substrate-binding protein